VGQRASDDAFALRMHTVAISVERETVRTERIGFYLTLCEVACFANPDGSAVVAEHRSRFGSRLRERKLLVELFVLWHQELERGMCSQKWLWGEHPISGPQAW
jgi:hypothetical protein